MRIARNAVVSIQYTLTNEAGQLLDSSPKDEPLEYLHGAAGILPALERALAGKAVGESFDVTITPDRGFGERQPSLIEVVPRSHWPNPEKLTVGAKVALEDPNGNKKHFVITGLTEDSVTVDGNHPLAGVTLRFQGAVVDIREATAEELAGAVAGGGPAGAQ